MKKLLSVLGFIGFFFLFLFFSNQKASAETLYVYFGSNNRSNIIWQVGFRVIMNYDDFSDRRYTSTYKTLVNSNNCSGWNRCGGATIYPSGPQSWRVQWGTACIDPEERVRPFRDSLEENNIYATDRINITDNTSTHRADLDWYADNGGGTLWFAGYTTTRNCPNKPDPRYRIQGRVFVDKNRDGNRDSGEPNYKGALIEKWGSGGGYETDRTGDSGFNFYNLPADNNYRVQLTVPRDYVATNDRNRTNLDLPPTREFSNNREINFGIAPDRGAISGVVYVDEWNGNNPPNGKIDGNDVRRRDETVRIDPNGANDTRRTNREGFYKFDDLNPGSDHTIRLEGIDACKLNVTGDNPKTNVNAPAGGNNNVHFRLTRRYFEIVGNVYRYVAGVCTPTINTNCQAYGRSVKVTAVGTGRNDDSKPGDSPDYKITRILDQNGAYAVRLTGLRDGESVVGGYEKDVTVNCANARQDFYIRPAGANEFQISGTVYVDSNNNGTLQKGTDEIYDGGGTVQIRTGNNSASTGRTGPVGSNGNYAIDNNPQNTNYTVRLQQGTLASGYTVLNNDRPVNMGTEDVAQINFLVDAPANTYTVRGGVYIDNVNPEGKKTAAEPYTAASGNERIRIQGLPAGANCPQNRSSFVRDINNFTGEFIASGIQPGCYRVEFNGPSGRGANWRVTYPSGISPFTIGPIIVGPNCNDDATDQDGVALCATGAGGGVNGNITNVDFGIKQQDDNPWYQSVGGDVRIDEDNYRNIIPDGTSPICTNSTYPYVSSNSISGNLTSGIVFTGNNPNLTDTGTDRSKASNQGWLVAGNEFSPSRPGTIRTSYTYMNNIIEKGRLRVEPMFGSSSTTACNSSTGPDCTFRANIPNGLLNGVYKSTTPVTIRGSGNPETYTFPDGRDYVFLIEDDLRIESNIQVNPGSTVTFIVSGDIIISPDVTELDGIYSADGSFITQGITTGANDQPLKIEGNVIANAGLNSGKKFDQRRDLGDNQNVDCPAVTIVSRPDFILNGPELIRYTNYVIQEIAPGADRSSQGAGGFLIADTYTPPFTPVPNTPTPRNTNTPTPSPKPVLKPGFDGTSGVVTINAEASDANYVQKFSRSGHSWNFKDKSSSSLSYTGSGFVAALPNNGTNITSNHSSSAPEIRYNICFDVPGRYWVWARSSAPDANSDLIKFEVDGAIQNNANTLKLYVKGVGGNTDWEWSGKENDGAFAYVNISTPGFHTLSLYMRKDGARIDKIHLRNTNNTPSFRSAANASSAGPDQSGKTTCEDNR